MKFSKEEAREKITAMFSKEVEKIDDWERTIKENVETLCDLVGGESEIELDAFAEKAVKMLKTQKGHINKANSTVAETFNKQIEELNKQIEEAAKKKAKGENGNGDEDPNNEIIIRLEERLKKLEEERQAEEARKTIGQKREQLAAEIKKKGVKNDKWVKSMLEKAKIDESTDVEKEADSYLEMYNEFFSQLPEDNSTPGAAGAASHLEKIKATIKAAGEALKAEQGD